jgi:hypothetical protein
MTIPQAIIIGAFIVAASVVGSRLVAPYEITSGTAIAWRINTITGAVELCNASIDVSNPTTANPRCR